MKMREKNKETKSIVFNSNKHVKNILYDIIILKYFISFSYII